MTARKLAAIYGFLGVALGAFGRHWLGDRLSVANVTIWQTATMYHLIHAVAMLATGLPDGRPSRATIAFALGITFFSGSLYVLAGTDIRWLGGIAPLGGLCLLAGWALLLVPERTR